MLTPESSKEAVILSRLREKEIIPEFCHAPLYKVLGLEVDVYLSLVNEIIQRQARIWREKTLLPAKEKEIFMESKLHRFRPLQWKTDYVIHDKDGLVLYDVRSSLHLFARTAFVDECKMLICEHFGVKVVVI